MAQAELQAEVAQCSTVLELCQQLEMKAEALVLSERLTAARAKAQALAKAESQSSVQQQQSVWDTSGHTSMQKSSNPTFSPVAAVELSSSALADVSRRLFDVLSQKQGSGDFSLLVFSQGSWRNSRPRL